MLQSKDKIYNIKKFQFQTLYETWLLFKKFITVPNHIILGRNLLKIFHRSMNMSTKAVSDTITSWTFVSIRWELAMKILDQVSNTNQGCNTREAKGGVGIYLLVLPIRKQS